MLGQTPTPGREVSEDENALAGGEHRFDDLLESGQLARPTGEWSPVVAIGRRVITDLLERSDGGEDRSLLGFARVSVGLGDELIEDRLIEPDLFGRHRAVIELIDLVGKLGRHLWF